MSKKKKPNNASARLAPTTRPALLDTASAVESRLSLARLAAAVAHEINNQISYIHSNLGSLSRYIEDIQSLLGEYERLESSLGERAEIEALHKLKREMRLEDLHSDTVALLAESRDGIGRIAKIVADLRHLSRAGHPEERAPFDLHDGLERAIDLAKAKLHDGITLRRHYGTLPIIECVAIQIIQVCINILHNAAEAIPEQGTITVRTGSNGTDWVFAEIQDTGRGISSNHHSKIFEPFFSTRDNNTFTGLGLTIAAGIVSEHLGHIEWQSAEGEGSTFRIWLPISQART